MTTRFPVQNWGSYPEIISTIGEQYSLQPPSSYLSMGLTLPLPSDRLVVQKPQLLQGEKMFDFGTYAVELIEKKVRDLELVKQDDFYDVLFQFPFAENEGTPYHLPSLRVRLVFGSQIPLEECFIAGSRDINRDETHIIRTSLDQFLRGVQKRATGVSPLALIKNDIESIGTHFNPWDKLLYSDMNEE